MSVFNRFTKMVGKFYGSVLPPPPAPWALRSSAAPTIAPPAPAAAPAVAPPPAAVAAASIHATMAQVAGEAVEGELPAVAVAAPPAGVRPIIDFTKGHIASLPEWFQRESYKIVMGSGDIVFPDGRTDIEVFQRYDVHCCMPNYGNQEEENIAYILENRLNKLICLINVEKADQFANFVDLFEHKVTRIHYVTHGPPIASVDILNRLLVPNGILTINSMGKWQIPGEPESRHRYGSTGDDLRREVNHPIFSCEENIVEGLLTCVKKSQAAGRRKGRKRTRRVLRGRRGYRPKRRNTSMRSSTKG